MNRGFTIIELLTVTAIIVVMTGLILPNWQAGKSQFALERSTSKLAQDIRWAEEMALAASEVAGQLPYGYGLHIDLSDPYTYFLYADFDGTASDGDLNWNGGPNCKNFVAGQDCIIETIPLEKRVTISNLGGSLPNSNVSIAFAAPTPTVKIYPAPPANITLSTEAGTKSICVNSLGLIESAGGC